MITKRIAAIAMCAALATSALIAPQASAATGYCVGDTFTQNNPTVKVFFQDHSTTFEKWDNTNQNVLKAVKKEDGKTTYEVLKGAQKGDNSVRAEFKQTSGQYKQTTKSNVNFKLKDAKDCKKDDNKRPGKGKGGNWGNWDKDGSSIDSGAFSISSRS